MWHPHFCHVSKFELNTSNVQLCEERAARQAAERRLRLGGRAAAEGGSESAGEPRAALRAEAAEEKTAALSAKLREAQLRATAMQEEALESNQEKDTSHTTHPIFPICRTAFPPYVRNEFSFFVFFFTSSPLHHFPTAMIRTNQKYTSSPLHHPPNCHDQNRLKIHLQPSPPFPNCHDQNNSLEHAARDL